MAAIILSPLPHFFSSLEHRCILYSTISCSNIAFSLHGITPIRFLFSWNLYHGRLSSIPLYHSMKSGINKLFTIMHQQDLQGNPGQSQASLGNSELSQPTISEYFTLPDATLGHSTQLQDILRSLGNSGRPWATGANGCTVAPRSFSVIVFNQYIKEKQEIPTLPSHLLSNVENYHCSCYDIGDVVLGSDLVVYPGTF